MQPVSPGSAADMSLKIKVDLDGGSESSIRLSEDTEEIFIARLCRFYKRITNVKKPLS